MGRSGITQGMVSRDTVVHPVTSNSERRKLNRLTITGLRIIELAFGWVFNVGSRPCKEIICNPKIRSQHSPHLKVLTIMGCKLINQFNWFNWKEFLSDNASAC
jgi:hypothetical protein